MGEREVSFGSAFAPDWTAVHEAGTLGKDEMRDFRDNAGLLQHG
jgi:hypothetical protein